MPLHTRPALTLRTLGPLRLMEGDAEVMGARRMELALLAYLVRRSPAAATRAELATLMWGERGEERARHSLRQSLSAMRRLVGGALEVAGEGVRIAPGSIALDASAFEAEVAAGRLAAALELWGGDFLEFADDAGGELYRSWLDSERARLQRLLERTLERWVAEAEAAGDWGAVVERAERWAAHRFTSFRPAVSWVRGFQLAGRPDEALARHDEFSARQDWYADLEPTERAEWSRLRVQLEREERVPPLSRSRLGPVALPLPDLVGRGETFRELRAAWDAARAGRAEFLLVSGEEGSGKTRVVDEFLQWLESSAGELLILRAHAIGSQRMVPWSTARDLFSALRDAPGLTGASGEALASITCLAPWVRERFPGLSRTVEDEPSLPTALAEVLACVAAEIPLVLTVDDLADADPESAGLLIELARRLPAGEIMTIATLRTGDAAHGPESLDFSDLPSGRRLRLKPLTRGEVETVVGSMLDLSVIEHRELSSRLHAESGGNPQYIVELLGALVDEEFVYRDESSVWRMAEIPAGRPLPLPPSVRDLVSRRLARLEPAAREVLDAAAVLGDRFDTHRLEVTGAFDPDALARALHHLVARRLIREVPGAAGSYAFNHSLVRRVAYDRLLPTRRDALLRGAPAERVPWYRRLWQAPDEIAVDAGAEGEWLAARLRLAVMALLLVLHTYNVASDPEYMPYRTGFVVTLLAALVAAAIYLFLRSGGYRPWLGFLSSTLDVSLVSLGLASFLLAGDPHAAVNSKPTFEIYFLAILGSSLRYDRRICLSAGTLAMIQYLAIVAYADARWELNDPAFAPFPYGMFSWSPQIARLILLLLAMLLSWEIVRRAQRLRHGVTHDPLTGLPNRSSFEGRCAVELARARRYGYDLAIARFDVDDFRSFNQAHGRGEGDNALRRLAEILESAVRTADVVARVEGGNFMMLLPQVSPEEAERKVAALRDELARTPFRLRDHTEVGTLEINAGLACFPRNGVDVARLLERVDAQLREQKKERRERLARLTSQHPVAMPEAVPAAQLSPVGEMGTVAEPAPTVAGPSATPTSSFLRPRDAGDRGVEGPPRWHPSPLIAAAAFAVLIGGTVLLASLRGGSDVEVRPVLAIGEIRDFTGGDSMVARVLPDLLATNLARATELQVVSTARMYELLARGAEGGSDAAALATAARLAGATELVEGALYRRVDGSFRLDLRRVRLVDGAVSGSFTAVGGDPFSLVDAATMQLLDERARGGTLRIADVTSSSVAAYRFFQEGLRLYYLGDEASATRFFEAALREDSTFAMAAYYAALAVRADGAAYLAYLTRAARLADRADDRHRLLIRGARANARNEPGRLAIAETLAVRYPAEPDGQYLLGHAKLWSGDFTGAVPHLRRAIAMDSAGASEEQPRCRACEAAEELVTAYLLADSAAAAERAARDWLRRMPRSAGALDWLANTLEVQGRDDEALAMRRSAAHQPAGTTLQQWEAVYAIRGADFARADRLLRAQAESGSRGERASALWFLTISLRYQGRMSEALRTAREYRALAGSPGPGGAPHYEALPEAIVLFEAGQPRRAAALFDSLARSAPEPGSATAARWNSWMLTHAATALAAGGDTAALRLLIPRIQEQGSRSAYGRDPRLHHHARGLLWSARGRHQQAAASFGDAVFSTTFGYTRSNLELARALMKLGQYTQAVEILRAALRGSLGASNLYVTRTDLHEALARAFEAAGEPDSAAAHYRRVERAWANADPAFQSRRAAALERSTPRSGW